jgi:uncharacterized membrane protein
MTPSGRTSTQSTRPAALAVGTLGTILLGLLATGQVARAGKPAPPPPAPVLPPVRYTLQWLDGGPEWRVAMPKDINRWGDMAGIASADAVVFNTAFAYCASTGQTINLNELNAEWWDLNGATPTPAGGWRASSAFGINDSGAIAGGATSIDPNRPNRAFVLEGAFGATPRFLLLPTVGAVAHYGRRINNNGEVVGTTADLNLVRYKRMGDTWPFYTAVREAGISTDGTMDINDDGVVVARTTDGSYRQLASGTAPAYFAGHEFWSVSNGPLAMISGYRAATNGKNGLPGGPIRLPVLGTASSVQLLSSGSYARAINDYGDTVFEAAGRGFLYYDPDSDRGTPNPFGTNGDGILPLDRMVVTQEPGWLDTRYLIRFDGVNNRDATGLGQICGFAYGPARGFVLTPVPAP